MQKNWEKFESDCVKHLTEKYGKYAQFYGKGGCDSTVSDIEVVGSSGKSFYIEAKCCPAQCGQFVLLPDIGKGEFVYSNKNATPINGYSKAIMEHMNKSFDLYKEAGTRGVSIEFENSSEIFACWIKELYKSKGAEFFISNGFKLFRTDDIGYAFQFSAMYRTKRSGSNDVGYGKMGGVCDYLKESFPSLDVYSIRKKLFARTNAEMHNRRFVLDGTEYMFSKRGDAYEIRRLSNTFNANVIFSIQEKSVNAENGKGTPVSDSEFISRLLR